MHKYITMVGRSYWATLNSIWAVIKNDMYEPENVILLSEENFKERAESLKDDIEILLEGYGFEPSVEIKRMENADFYHAGEEVLELVDGGEDSVALDITGGRKSLVAGALVNPGAHKLKHVFYLYLDEIKDADRPYPSIDSDRMMIKDFVDIFRRYEDKFEREGI